MKEAYVKFGTAQRLKQKGFDWDTYHYYDEIGRTWSEDVLCDWNHRTTPEVSCPTQQMAMRWLREEHDIMIVPNRDKIVDVAPDPFYDYYCIIRHNGNEYWVSSLDLSEGQHYTEYEDAIEAALQYCLTNLI